MRSHGIDRMPGGAAARLRPEIAAGLRMALALGFFGAFGPIALSLANMAIFAFVLPTGSMSTLFGLLAGFSVAAVMVILVIHIRNLGLIRLSHRIARRLISPALVAVAARPGTDPARATAEVLRDVEEVRRGIAGPLCRTALDVVLVPMLLLILAWYHWAFAAFALAAALIALLLSILGDKLTRETLAEANGEALRGSGLVADAVRSAEAVAVMGMLPAMVRRWAGSLARSAHQLRAAQSGARAIDAVTTVIYGAVSVGTMVVGILVVESGAIIGYGMIAAMLLTSRLVAPFGQFGGLLEDAAVTRAAWDRLDRLLREADARPPAAMRSWPCPEGRLSVERVTFVHPGSSRPLLREISFSVAPGELVALSGPPGAGKSTLLRLMLGIERPTAGDVYLDGHSTNHWDREDLARHVGFLAQDPALPGGTVVEAIARLSPKPDMQEVLRATRMVGAERLIASLPNGFATPLGGAIRLSMGQRQRIALIRAVFGMPRLVILDEPASYLDEEGEMAVARLLAALRQAGTAVVFTSHREGLIRCAGRVLRLNEHMLPPPKATPLLPKPADAMKIRGAA